jgi:glycosyltransferase involved in cell wall biosynthesis
MTVNKRLTVCYFGTYRADYSRNQIMIAGLRAAGVEVVECHAPLWRGIEDRVQVASGQWASLAFIRRLLSTYTRLLLKYAALDKRYDVMVLGYPGQLDVFLARVLTWIRRKPLVLDLFMSIYLIALERHLQARSALSVTLLRWLEAGAGRLPDLLICDTGAYVTWHHRTHGLDPKRFRLVPTGADDRLFKPTATLDRPADGQFRVLYYGTYIPNHGVETIIEAAHLLKQQPEIRFELIGAGPARAGAQALADRYALHNTTFTDWLEKEALVRKIAGADLLLGAFGATPQSVMTIQNKIYESLAMGKPLVTGDSPTVRDTLAHRVHVYLVERADPSALAKAITLLHGDRELRRTLSENGYAHYRRHFSLEQIGFVLRQHLIGLIRGRVRP